MVSKSWALMLQGFGMAGVATTAESARSFPWFCRCHAGGNDEDSGSASRVRALTGGKCPDPQAFTWRRGRADRYLSKLPLRRANRVCLSLFARADVPGPVADSGSGRAAGLDEAFPEAAVIHTSRVDRGPFQALRA